LYRSARGRVKGNRVLRRRAAVRENAAAVLSLENDCVVERHSADNRWEGWDARGHARPPLFFSAAHFREEFAMIRPLGRLLSLSLLATVAWAVPARAQERGALEWPSRIMELSPSASAKPPVVTALSLHASGLLAAAGDDHLVRVWDLAEGTLLHRLEGHTDWVRSAVYSPTDDLLATAGNDKQILLWHAQTGEKQQVLAAHPEAIAMLAFSPDGKFLAAVGFEATVRVYDLALGRVALELEGTCADQRAVAFSPSGKYLAAGGRCGKVRVWSLADGEVALEDAEHGRRVRAIAFSPDGKWLASCGDDRQVVVRDVAAGAAPIKLPPRPAKVMTLLFHGNDQLATAGSDNLIRLWDLETVQEVGRLSGHTGTIAALAGRDRTLISAGYDTTVRVWRMGDRVAEQPPATPRVGGLPGAPPAR
jgi:WD40 repeat protein